MNRLRKFYEKMPDGRSPSRVAYVTSPAALPEPVPDAEWTEDAAFNAGDDIPRESTTKERIQGSHSKRLGDGGRETIRLQAGMNPIRPTVSEKFCRF